MTPLSLYLIVNERLIVSDLNSLPQKYTNPQKNDLTSLTLQSMHTGGGAGEVRTPDPLRARQVLSQLSYGPSDWLVSCEGYKWWVWVDLNHRPHPYQGCALTN